MKKYRVITKDQNESYTIMSDWQSYTDCKAFIIGMWGHWPPFAIISTAKTDVTIKRALNL